MHIVPTCEPKCDRASWIAPGKIVAARGAGVRRGRDSALAHLSTRHPSALVLGRIHSGRNIFLGRGSAAANLHREPCLVLPSPHGVDGSVAMSGGDGGLNCGLAPPARRRASACGLDRGDRHGRTGVQLPERLVPAASGRFWPLNRAFNFRHTDFGGYSAPLEEVPASRRPLAAPDSFANDSSGRTQHPKVMSRTFVAFGGRGLPRCPKAVSGALLMRFPEIRRQRRLLRDRAGARPRRPLQPLPGLSGRTGQAYRRRDARAV